MPLRAGHTEILVSDPGRARAFYVDALGLEVEAEQPGGFTWLRSGGVTLLLRPGRRAPATESYQRAASALVLYTDDLDAERARLEAAGVEMRGTDGSPRCLTFTDPDGNWFQLVDPADHG